MTTKDNELRMIIQVDVCEITAEAQKQLLVDLFYETSHLKAQIERGAFYLEQTYTT